jgi:hypothetical protein
MVRRGVLAASVGALLFVGASSLTVLQMLSYVSSQYDVASDNWYGGSPTLGALAADAFDTVNAQGAFTA